MKTLDAPFRQDTKSLECKISSLVNQFLEAPTPEDKYRLLMTLGKKLPPFNPVHKTDKGRVSGCQSQLYLHAEKKEGQIFFSAHSDALISAGLAALLIEVYNGEPIESILLQPPQFLEQLGLHTSLSPNRSSGFFHIYLKMKQLAIKLIPLNT